MLQEKYNVQEPAFQPYARQFHTLIKESGSKTVLFGTASILSDYPKGFERQHGLHIAMGKELGVSIVDASYAYIRYFGEKPSTERLESLFVKDIARRFLCENLRRLRFNFGTADFAADAEFSSRNRDDWQPPSGPRKMLAKRGE